MKSDVSIRKVALTITTALLAAGSARAYDLTLSTNWPTISFHGFASQGFLASSDYNYLDNDTRNGSFRFTEIGLNASFNPFPRTRIAAQAFTYDIGDVGKFDLVLDYGLIEYTFNDKIGIRAGRIRRPEGIYNDIQDVDLARTFVLLPQGIYDCRWRDFYVSMDGGELFGTLPLNKAGDLSYELYGGVMHPAMDGGVANLLRSLFGPVVRLDGIDDMPETGGQLWWNTPLSGLRIGAGGGYNFGFTFHSSVITPKGYVPLPTAVSDIPFVQGSIEYTWKSWTFQTEYFTYWVLPETGADSQTDAWSASASYRFNKWFEAGTYYTEYYGDVEHRDDARQYQKDLALALRFDATSWAVFKIEGHYIHGTGLLDDPAANPSPDNRGWFLLAVKATLSF